ncbi:hypothetical protein RB594_006419 [Gaeumannomyces avenae]
MRIGCLQFAAKKGDIDWNLKRADSVLAKADPAALDHVDLIVCPELAFTGSNFDSLQDIYPYLEPSTSGITALWARTIALRYNATVAVGYPEKVETEGWSTSPEYYNSLVVVNGDGETVANVRKRSLSSTDPKWALESKQDGFVSTHIEGIGQTTIGISTDLFTSPSDCEFALHAVKAASNLVLVSMSWAAKSEARLFSRTPAEPDMDALTAWTQQLVPLIEEEGREEVIVVFCNRCGSEENGVAYSGTSAVLGIKNGNVSVYGLLGRATKELLVVDTENPPFARLVQADSDQPILPRDAPSALHQRSESGFKQSQPSPGSVPDKTWPPVTSASEMGAKCRAATPPRQARHQTREGSPSPATTRTSRAKSNIPKLHIPSCTSQGTTHRSTTHEDADHILDMSGEETSPSVMTPTYPSPIPLHLRPQVTAKPAGGNQPAALGTNVKSRHLYMPLSPTTPFLEFFRNTSPSSPVSPFCFPASPPRNQDSQLYWVPSRQLLKSPTSTAMSPLDTPVDRVMSMFSSCQPTLLAAKTNQPSSTPLAREAKQALADLAELSSPSTKPNTNKNPAAEPTSRPRTGSTSCKAAQLSMPSLTSSASEKIWCKIQPAKTRSQGPDITTSPIVPHSTTESMDIALPLSRCIEAPLDHKNPPTPPSMVDSKPLPETRSRSAIPGGALSSRRSHSNDSFSARTSPPFTRPSSRRAQTRHGQPRSRSLSGSEQRGRQGGNHDSLEHINFTPGGAMAHRTSSGTHEEQGAAPLAPSPGSASHFRGRIPEIPRPSSIPRQRQPTSSAIASEIPRPSSIPRNRRGTSNQSGLRSRDQQTHQLDSDPDNEIVATISRITANCPHHSVNRPMGPVVQSADGSLYTIELPQHVQDLALSLLTKPSPDTQTDSRRSLVRKSLVW